MSSLQQNWRKGQNMFFLEVKGVGEKDRGQGAGGSMTVYIHMNR
jgi:hypothetical protein